MTTPTTAAGVWPARLCYAAAGIFSLASGGTNLIYGWNKGTDLPSSIVWAAVSLGVSIVFASSWPAFIRSVDARHWSRAVMVLVALLITGAYSVSAALGSAMGGRANAAIEEQNKSDDRAKVQAAYDAAKAELDALAAKPAIDLQSLIDNAKAELARLPAARPVSEIEVLIRNASQRGCHGGVALSGQLRANCPKYDVELARARERQQLVSKVVGWTNDLARADQRRGEQRERVKAAMEKASAELARSDPAKLANSDAVALAAYLQGLGIGIDADRANKLLVLLAVLAIECGGGLALGVGMSLSGADGHAADTGVSGRTQDERTPADTADGHQPSIIGIANTNTDFSELDTMKGRAADTGAQSAAAVRLLSFVRERGGVLVGGQRAMAQALGWSKSKTHEVLHGLASKGFVRLTTGRTGTIVQLAA